MKWINIALIIALIVLAFLAGFLLQKFVFTGAVIANNLPDKTLTKAVCNNNSCQDVLISCKNGSVISMTPITGEIVFSEDWQDPRTDSALCE